MKYSGQPDYSHNQPQKTGVLITNLGTPDAPETSALRRYLAEFLADPRVVEVPRLLWWFILHGIILRFRPARSAHAYRQVWTEQGSPLLFHTQSQHAGLEARLQDHYGDSVIVDYAMRYGKPAIGDVLEKLQRQGAAKLLVLPLYPQYSAATTASTFDALSADFRRRRWLPELRFITHYHDYPDYIAAMAQHIEQHWDKTGRGEKLILSYHGIPLRYLKAGDPYFCECHKTSRLLAEKLGLQESEYQTSFQSRFGREAWLQPYTDEILKSLPGKGVNSVDVFCPGFSADCLETLEEIDVENRGYFLQAGGKRFQYIPALNAENGHLNALFSLISDNLAGWNLSAENASELEARRARADKTAKSLGLG